MIDPSGRIEYPSTRSGTHSFLAIGEHQQTAQKPRTSKHLVDDRKDVAISELTKWLRDFPSSLCVRRYKLQEAACQAIEKDDS
jgi:hypothetical protein